MNLLSSWINIGYDEFLNNTHLLFSRVLAVI